MSENNDPHPRWRGWINELFSNGESKTPDHEIHALIDTVEQAETLDPQSKNLVIGVLDLNMMKASDVMVPRGQMSYIKAECGIRSALNILANNPHSRYPVIGENIDDIQGILHAKDVLPWFADGKDIEGHDLKDIIRSPVRVPENKGLTNLLQEFRTSRNHLAIVVNEYGNVSGLITIEDVLEQIVGNIEDEHDAVVKDERVLEEEKGQYRVDPLLPIVEFNEVFDANFSNEDVDTIGGIVVNSFGRVPEKDEECTLGNFRFIILKTDRRRVQLLRVIPQITDS